MLRSITHTQFLEWMAFSELEPFAPERLEQVISQIVWVLMNINRKKNSSPIRFEKCVPLFGDATIGKKGVDAKDWRTLKALFKQGLSDPNDRKKNELLKKRKIERTKKRREARRAKEVERGYQMRSHQRRQR